MRDDDLPYLPHWFEPRLQLAESTKLGMRNILVVDDNAEVAAITADMLRALGHEVEVVHSGEEAVEATVRLRPDLLLLDIGMPDMDGYETAARIRAKPGLNPEMQIIGITGWGAEGHLARSCQAGFDKFWSKPVTLSGLQTL